MEGEGKRWRKGEEMKRWSKEEEGNTWWGGFEPGDEQNRRGQLKRQELPPITASRLILPSQMC